MSLRVLSNIRSLNAVRARKFLRSLGEKPFVAIVMEDEHPVVYCKDITVEDTLRIMQSVADQLESEEAHAGEENESQE